MTNVISIQESPLRHTYPFGSHDKVMEFGNAEQMRDTVAATFAADPECRRIVVAVEQGNLDQIAECEKADLRYVLDVAQRDGAELSLLVAEPEWVTSQSTDIKDLKLQ